MGKSRGRKRVRRHLRVRLKKIRQINWRAYRFAIVMTVIALACFALQWGTLIGYMPNAVAGYRTHWVLSNATDAAIVVAFLAAVKSRCFDEN